VYADALGRVAEAESRISRFFAHDGGPQCAGGTVDLTRRGKTVRFP
jgi:hypothetical protein